MGVTSLTRKFFKDINIHGLPKNKPNYCLRNIYYIYKYSCVICILNSRIIEYILNYVLSIVHSSISICLCDTKYNKCFLILLKQPLWSNIKHVINKSIAKTFKLFNQIYMVLCLSVHKSKTGLINLKKYGGVNIALNIE